MSDWTINGQTMAALGVENLSINLQNMDDDSAQIYLAENYDLTGNPAFAVGASVVIKYGEAVALRGIVDNPAANASPATETKTVQVFGPWHRMAKTPFLYSYPYNGGATQTTHCKTGGVASTALAAILAAAQSAGLLTAGTIDVGTLTVPESDQYDLTLAEAIRAIMRYIPGGLVVFDYSTTPPTCNIFADNSATLATVAVDPAAGECASFNFTPRHDLKLDGVKLFYEVAETRKSRVWRHKRGYAPTDVSTVTSEGFAYVGEDSAGATTGNVLRKTVLLGGHRTITELDWLCQNTGVKLSNVLWETSAPANWVWLKYFMRMNSPRFDPLDKLGNPTSPVTTLKTWSIWPVSSGISTYPTEATEGAKWPMLERIFDFGDSQTAVYDYDNMALRKYPAEILYSPEYTSGLKVIEVEVEWRWTHPNYTGEQTSNGQMLFYYSNPLNQSPGGIRTIIEGDVDSMPSGVAAKILAQNNRLLYEGELTINAESTPLMFSGVNRKLSIAAPAFTTPIQTVLIDANTGTLTVRFGPPEQLGPQDFISLMKAEAGVK